MLTECCTALDCHHIAISPHLQQESNNAVHSYSTTIGPPLRVVFLDERPPLSNPSPFQVNWMAPRHSVRPVSYRADWPRPSSSKPNNYKREKERINPKTQTSSCLLRRSVEPPWYDPLLASIGVPFFSRAARATACKHSVGRHGM